MKNWIKRVALAVAAGALILSGASACAEIAPPDQVGLYYMKGNSDGYHFGHCFDPGHTTDSIWNNEVVFLPASLRTWYIAPENTPGADSNTPITVQSRPEDNQPSGVQVNLWTSTNFTLNTLCGNDGKDPNSPIVVYWEKIGKRYFDADPTPDKSQWWKNMLSATIVTALDTSSRAVAREYTDDQLVSLTVREEAQNKIAALFQSELKRVTGGDFFCSPTFDRLRNPTCGAVEVLLRDVDYTNPETQLARDSKQAAEERAAAAVIDAQGKVDAAAKVGSLFNNPAWVELEKLKLQKEIVQECAKGAGCTVVLDSGGAAGVNVNTK